MSVNPFDYTNSVSHQKNYMMVDDYSEQNYNPFLTNKQFSLFHETVLFANELNISTGVPKKLQYDFYFFLLPKKKRFSKWHEKQADKDVDLIKKVYAVSETKAAEYLEILSDKQLKELKEKFDVGGRN